MLLCTLQHKKQLNPIPSSHNYFIYLPAWVESLIVPHPSPAISCILYLIPPSERKIYSRFVSNLWHHTRRCGSLIVMLLHNCLLFIQFFGWIWTIYTLFSVNFSQLQIFSRIDILPLLLESRWLQDFNFIWHLVGKFLLVCNYSRVILTRNVSCTWSFFHRKSKSE
jgi:hypothetical protein